MSYYATGIIRKISMSVTGTNVKIEFESDKKDDTGRINLFKKEENKKGKYKYKGIENSKELTCDEIKESVLKMLEEAVINNKKIGLRITKKEKIKEIIFGIK